MDELELNATLVTKDLKSINQLAQDLGYSKSSIEKISMGTAFKLRREIHKALSLNLKVLLVEDDEHENN